MPLSSIDIVRSLVGDMAKPSVQEDVARGDGVTTEFQLDMYPVRTGTLTVYNTGAAVSASANIALGTFQLTNSAPVAGNFILATYQYNALSDQEIQSCIDLASAAGSILAASYAARSLAGNQARYFAYTQGDKSVNKNDLSKKFLDLAESLEEAYEKNIKLVGITMSMSTYDASGTNFDNYDTGSSYQYADTGTH